MEGKKEQTKNKLELSGGMTVKEFFGDSFVKAIFGEDMSKNIRVKGKKNDK